LSINKRGNRVLRFLFLWSRGESNPCPNIATISFLHAYFMIICRCIAGHEQTNTTLSWMVLNNSHSLLL